jgi:hypothetical protein
MLDEELQGWLDALIQGFKSRADRKKLYDEVDSAAPLAAKRSQDGYWGSISENGQTVIEVVPSKNPEAALAHELLHARLKVRGYKQYCVTVAMVEKRDGLPGILTMLDNELQHNKFFHDFLGLGFTADQMYADSDAEWALYLRQKIELLSPEEPLESFLSVYATLIAPGGFGTAEERKELEEELRKRCASDYWKRLRAIKAAITDFRDSPSLDAQTVIGRILRELGGYESVWIGTDQNFPASGFFVGEPFTMEAMQEYLRAHRGDAR